MKSWVGHGRLAAGILALVLFCSSSAAFAAVGRTVGTYQVSPTGAATYTIPIWAPRGPNGLQPHISLVYNSQQGSGYIGVGWALAGISSIYRCNRTYAQDTDPESVALTTSDGLCLDGQRLRLTSGSADEAGSTYQTEVANFENVTAYGTAGNGPASFVVQASDGTQYEYGNTAISLNSQVLASGTSTAFQWYLDKVTDTFGNTMTVSYCSGTSPNCVPSDPVDGAVVPATISWTPSSHDATDYTYTMTFGYIANPGTNAVYAYVGGTQVVSTNLLASVTIAYSGNTVKKYALTYQQSPTTGREELAQVEECADNAQTNCLAPTTITYQNGVAGTEVTPTSAVSSIATYLVSNYDFNGDGLNDLAFCSGGSPSTVKIALATGNGYGAPINSGVPCAGALYGDLLANGQDGILANNGGTWYYYTLNGGSFSGVSTGVAYDSTASQYVLADVNGDGYPDLIESKLTANSSLTIYARLNATTGSTLSFLSTNATWFTDPDPNITGASLTSNSDGGYGYGNLRRLDFNGDGRDDLELEVQDTIITHQPPGEQVLLELTVDELIASPGGFTKTQIALKTSSHYMPYVPIAFINFNSDACTDLLFTGDGSTTSNLIAVSGCNGSVGETVTFGPIPVIGAMDWNGDGLTDILVQNGSTIGVYESNDNGIGGLKTTSVPYNSSNTYFTFDADGDGLDDLGVVSGTSPYPVSYYPHYGDGHPPDLLSSVTDGYGNFAKPTYVSIAQTAGSTYVATNDASYPYKNYLGPLYVVNQTTFSDPSNPPNATYQVSDYYAGAWMNLEGRGFAGFSNHQTHDARNGIWDTVQYNRSFPYTGMVRGEIITQNNTPQETILNRSNTLSDTVLDNTVNNQRYFPNVSSSTESDYEVGGSENTELITTKTGSYQYDNYGNVKSASRTITDNDSGSPYNGDSWTQSITNIPDVDTSTWCLRLSSETQVTYTASDDSPSVTRTRDFSPDTAHCRITQVTTEPSSSYEVIEALHYDIFGNIDTDTVTGNSMAARQTSSGWGTTGQFPLWVKDASGQTTNFNYNFSYGLVSGETDPNGLSTSWTYGDGFGRVTEESRPDGTSTTSTYILNTGGPLTRLIVLEQPHDTAGNIITTTGFYFDMLDRPLYRTDILLDGTQVWGKVQNYDWLGRIATDCAPYPQTAASPGCTTYYYDTLNRVTEADRPINQGDSTLQKTKYSYAGRTTTIEDPYGHTRTLVADVNGWLRQTQDAVGYSVILGYDAAGAKTSVTDSLGNSLWTGSYAYGIAPFLLGESDKDRGAWGYTVDALGERTAWTDPKGKHFSATYDSLSRPLTRTEPDLFTHWTWGSSASSDNIGQLASVCTGTGSTCSSSYYSESEAYDNKGRLTQRSIVIPSMGTSTTYTYTWQYNATTGFLDTLTYPTSTSGQALELKYAYSSQNGMLQSITDILDSPNVTVWQANVENPAGQITQETLGNGLVTSRAYDGVTHWLSSVESGPGGGSSIQNQGFQYDEVGNVIQRQDNNLGLSENFYYDSDNRLSYSTLNGTQNLSLNYNAMGNITSRTDVAGGATWTYDPVHLHEVTQAGSSAFSYVYDANGNVTSRQGSSINWSSYNYPTTINDTATGESVSFIYGPDRRAYFEETQSSSGTETNYHIGGLLDIVTSAGVTDYRHYIYAGGEPVAIDSRKSSGTNALYYLLSDQQGSIAVITNSTGASVVGESFTAYGNRRNPTTWSGAPASGDLTTIAGITRQGYTFQDALGQMGLNDMVGRVQDAITGRFLSADPNIPNPTDPQSYNRYSYTRNNPLTYMDLTGFDDTAVTQNSNGSGGGFVPPDICIGEGCQLPQSPPPFSTCGEADVCDFIPPSGDHGWESLWDSGNTHSNQAPPTQGSFPYLWGPPHGPAVGGNGNFQPQSNSPQTLGEVTISGTKAVSFNDPNSFSNAYSMWFNAQTQWVPAGQQAIGAALQRAALPPRLILKLVSWSGDSAPQPNGSNNIIFEAGAYGGGTGFAAGAGYGAYVGYTAGVAEISDLGVIWGTAGVFDAISAGAIAGGTVGLAPGLLIGGAIGLAIYLAH